VTFLKKSQPAQIKPVNEQRKPGGSAPPLERDALLSAERNRWFFVSLGLLVLCLLLGLEVIRANARFANNVQVAWVKMAPNGMWDIDFFDEDRGPEFFQSTIDYMLSQFVERRYSKVRASIKNDYGFALQFMGPKLARSFMDGDQYNAPGKVAVFLDGGANETLIKIRAIDHYDSDVTTFGRVEGTLYRSNIFVEETMRSNDGALLGNPKKKIVALQWRIKSKEEIQADKKGLRTNPIGLEVIKADILNDLANTKG